MVYISSKLKPAQIIHPTADRKTLIARTANLLFITAEPCVESHAGFFY
jgi:hypothetical protein